VTLAPVIVRIPLVHDSDPVHSFMPFSFSYISWTSQFHSFMCTWANDFSLSLSLCICMWILIFQERYLWYVSFALFLNIKSNNRTGILVHVDILILLHIWLFNCFFFVRISQTFS
jgi:hypothetical protein